ncbi:MAG: hypothetical protein ABSG57_11865 [Candidatus Bathyarchaeia archaeon]
MENKDIILIFISILSIASTTILGITTYSLNAHQNSLSQAQNSLIQAQNNLSQALYELQVANMRANMSILVNPQFDQHWAFVANGVFLTVNGTLVNEGSRDAIVESMGLSVTYHYSDGTPYTVPVVEYSNLSKYCNVNITTIPEKGETSFSIGMFIHTETLAIIGGSYTSNPAILVIGNSRSDNFTVSVRYFDGIGYLQSEQEFSTNEV